VSRRPDADAQDAEAEAVYDPLPSDITITIHDDGHGMDANEIQDLFLAVTRNRRKDK